MVIPSFRQTAVYMQLAFCQTNHWYRTDTGEHVHFSVVNESPLISPLLHAFTHKSHQINVSIICGAVARPPVWMVYEKPLTYDQIVQMLTMHSITMLIDMVDSRSAATIDSLTW